MNHLIGYIGIRIHISAYKLTETSIVESYEEKARIRIFEQHVQYILRRTLSQFHTNSYEFNQFHSLDVWHGQ